MAADWENILKYREKIYHICSNERERREKEERGKKKKKERKPLKVSLSAPAYIFSLLSSSSTISTRLHPCPYSFITKITFFFFFLISFLPCSGQRPPAS
jgi:hypothetical protein